MVPTYACSDFDGENLNWRDKSLLFFFLSFSFLILKDGYKPDNRDIDIHSKSASLISNYILPLLN
jgi:hypothetical protein